MPVPDATPDEVPDLSEYRRRRDPEKTPEPFGDGTPGDHPIFVVQRHSARRLHYDLRLERDGALASWAVPKGVPMPPGARGLAVKVEDHPMEYAGFEGEIPAGQYGAGMVWLWDRGTYELVEEKRDGGLSVRLHGRRLEGTWALAPAALDGDPRNWLIIRKREDEPGRDWSDRRHPPMLAQLVDAPPAGPGWRHEVKWDGFRTMARMRTGTATLWSRGDQDLTERFASVARRVEASVLTPECVLDGEVCAVDEEGRPNFGLLQRGGGRLVYYVFDVLELEGRPLCGLPWQERREVLAGLLDPRDPALRVSDAFEDGPALLAAATARKLEGIVSKRVDAAYRPGARSPDWRKVKARQTDEFLVCGYTEGKGSRGRLGALVLGERADGELRWVGNCGSGFTQRELDRLLAVLTPLVRDDPPFDPPPKMPRVRRDQVTWVEPRLEAEVAYAERTSDARLRAPVYVGLRDPDQDPPDGSPSDPPAPDPAEPAPAPDAADPPVPARKLRLSNLDKVFFPDEGITKGDLIDYYAAVGPVLVSHLRDRPFTMVRLPDGIAGERFFQKDRPSHMPEWIPVAALPASTDPARRVIRFPVVNDVDALRWMVNMGCIDMNAWYSRTDMPDRPDFVLFDLDPSEGSSFREAVKVALLVKEVLDVLGLRGYPKTSSARGLHVMVPIERTHAYPEVRRFCSVVAEALAGMHRGLVTTEWTKAKRRGVLIDANQIGYGKTIASVYSVRPRPGAPVSTPLRWDEVNEDLDPLAFTMEVVLERVRRDGDLFAPVLEGGQELGPALARLS